MAVDCYRAKEGGLSKGRLSVAMTMDLGDVWLLIAGEWGKEREARKRAVDCNSREKMWTTKRRYGD